MKSVLAMVFPGQGSQSTRMLSELAQEYPTIQETFDRASSVLKTDLWKIAQHDDLKEQLNQTQYTQPIMLTADVAVYRCWQQCRGAVPVVMAGHSLGEYSALVCAEVLTFESALQLVQVRARYMTQASEHCEGAMAVMIGLDDMQIQQLCEQVKAIGYAAPANFNSFGQTVISGERKAIEKVMELSKTHGAKIAKIIPVSIPSHCRLMRPAAERLKETLSTVTFASPTVPILHNIDAQTHHPDELVDVLSTQMTQPVQWVNTIEAFRSYHVSTVLECGPGKVLSGLIKRIDKNIHCGLTLNITAFKQSLETYA
jgi:[acyl-carrier-protein] S-malonyltransferase